MTQMLIEALLRISEFSLIALGLSLVYGLAKFPNVAHVQYAMVGAYVSYVLNAYGIPLVLAVMLASAATGVLAIWMHKLIFARLLTTGPAITMIGSLAVSMLLTAVVLALAGSFPLTLNTSTIQSFRFGGTYMSAMQVYSVASTALVLLVFFWFWSYTKMGRAMRALATNPQLADASGLNASRIVVYMNFSSGLFAGLGGSLLALSSGAYVNMGHDLLLPVFAAAILGGLGNPLGAVLGAALIAVAETIVTNANFGWAVGQKFAFLPISYLSAVSFLLLLLALLFRPYGLFDREVRRV